MSLFIQPFEAGLRQQRRPMMAEMARLMWLPLRIQYCLNCVLMGNRKCARVEAIPLRQLHLQYIYWAQHKMGKTQKSLRT